MTITTNNQNFGKNVNPTRIKAGSYAITKLSNSDYFRNDTTNFKTNLTEDTFSRDVEILSNYKQESNKQESESLWGAIKGGVPFMAFTTSPQTLKHPINAIKAMFKADKMFDLNNPAIKEIWKKEPELVQNLYTQVHASYRNMGSKWKFLQGWFQKPLTGEALKQQQEYLKMAEEALKSGDKIKIAQATETLNATRAMDGYIPTAWNKIKNLFGGNAKNLTPTERVLAQGDKIATAANAKLSQTLFSKMKGEFKTFAIFNSAIELFTKVIPAYKEGGTKSAAKQTAQSALNVVGNCGGWAVGSALGSAAGVQVASFIGGLICPGVGNVVGALVGLAGGFVGSWIGDKIVSKIVPQQECDKLAAQREKSTAEGQTELVNNVLANVEAGKEVPNEVLQAANNVATKLQQVA